jgi:hypothetical protein
MSLSPGDPGSTSALGGALRTQAGRLADLVVDLDAAARRAGRTGSPDPTGLERDLVTRAATELDRVGGLLQSWTTTAVDSAARVRALEPALTRCDLVVDGRLVVERAGPSRVEPGVVRHDAGRALRPRPLRPLSRHPGRGDVTRSDGVRPRGAAGRAIACRP